MSHVTREDVAFCTIGFISICRLRIADGYSVLPSMVNSDVVENFFCQQRGSHEDNNNPTYLQYCKDINSIVMKTGGKSRVKKSNAGLKCACLHYNHFQETKTKNLTIIVFNSNTGLNNDSNSPLIGSYTIAFISKTKY